MVQIHKSLFRVRHWSTQIHGTGLCTYSLEQCHAYCFNSFNSVKVARNLWGCVEWASHYQLLQNRHYLVHPYNSVQDYPNLFPKTYISWAIQDCFSHLRTPGPSKIVSPNLELLGYSKSFPQTQNSWAIQNRFPKRRTPRLSKIVSLNSEFLGYPKSFPSTQNSWAI